MSIARRSRFWLFAGLTVAGIAWATLSNNFSYYWPSRGNTQQTAFRNFQTSTLPGGTIVSIINGDTGEYENYRWDGTSFVKTGDGGTVPTGGNAGGPEGGGSGGSGGGSDPRWGGVQVCNGACPVGEVTVGPPQRV